MGPVGGGGGGNDSYAILNDAREIDRAIDSVTRNIDQIKSLQQRALDDPDTGRDTKSSQDLRRLNDDTQALTSSLKDRVQKLKGRPGAGDTNNKDQVGRVSRKLQSAIQDLQRADADYRRKLTEQQERQYRIVRPDASEAEVKQACEDPQGMQVFSQAVCHSHAFLPLCSTHANLTCSFSFYNPTAAASPSPPCAPCRAGTRPSRRSSAT